MTKIKIQLEIDIHSKVKRKIKKHFKSHIIISKLKFISTNIVIFSFNEKKHLTLNISLLENELKSKLTKLI